MERHRHYLFLIAVVLFASCQPTPTGEEIVLRSLDAHGGIAAWEGFQQIRYRKTTTLYDSLGQVESTSVQTHLNRYQPEFYAEMQWSEDSINKKAIWKEGQLVSVGADSVQKQTYASQIQAAQYVFWQPYKLLEPDTDLHYQGVEHFDDGSQAHVVEVTYPDQPDSNTWWYFFDYDSYKLVATMVQHGATYSFIVNTSYENQTGLSLNASRKSYRVDEDRNIQFLRASYVYEILDWKN